MQPFEVVVSRFGDLCWMPYNMWWSSTTGYGTVEASKETSKNDLQPIRVFTSKAGISLVAASKIHYAGSH